MLGFYLENKEIDQYELYPERVEEWSDCDIVFWHRIPLMLYTNFQHIWLLFEFVELLGIYSQQARQAGFVNIWRFRHNT